MSLSDKIVSPFPGFLNIKDVKEFIKLLKEEIAIREKQEGKINIDNLDCLNLIDKLAGKALI